jgi:hypothetical protein
VVDAWLGLPWTAPSGDGRWTWGLVALQTVVGLYGGYLGAGIGILMLAVFIGWSDGPVMARGATGRGRSPASRGPLILSV